MAHGGDRKAIFAERLRQAAVARYGKNHGIVTRLSEDVGVSTQATSKWLRGEAMPRADLWGVIAGKLGVPVQWLVGASHELPPQLADVSDDALDIASTAARIVFPLVTRLHPDLDQETFDELFRHAYQELKAGRGEKEVAGDIAAQLI